MLGLILVALFLQGPRDVQLDNVTPKPPVIVAKGTVIPVELLNRLSTKNIKEGDNVYARTIFPITMNNEIVIPVGTNIQGKIQQAERPGRVKGQSQSHSLLSGDDPAERGHSSNLWLAGRFGRRSP